MLDVKEMWITIGLDKQDDYVVFLTFERTREKAIKDIQSSDLTSNMVVCVYQGDGIRPKLEKTFTKLGWDNPTERSKHVVTKLAETLMKVWSEMGDLDEDLGTL